MIVAGLSQFHLIKTCQAKERAKEFPTRNAHLLIIHKPSRCSLKRSTTERLQMEATHQASRSGVAALARRKVEAISLHVSSKVALSHRVMASAWKKLLPCSTRASHVRVEGSKPSRKSTTGKPRTMDVVQNGCPRYTASEPTCNKEKDEADMLILCAFHGNLMCVDGMLQGEDP